MSLPKYCCLFLTQSLTEAKSSLYPLKILLIHIAILFKISKYIVIQKLHSIRSPIVSYKFYQV